MTADCYVLAAAEMAQLSSTLVDLWLLTIAALVFAFVDWWQLYDRWRAVRRRRRIRWIRWKRRGLA